MLFELYFLFKQCVRKQRRTPSVSVPQVSQGMNFHKDSTPRCQHTDVEIELISIPEIKTRSPKIKTIILTSNTID